MHGLNGKVALVTGGARGIGRAICLRLAEEGCDVAVADLDEDGACETALLAKKRGRRSLPLVADVSQAAQVNAMVAEAVEELGGIDILVNNAGIVQVRPLLEVTEAEWARIHAVNVTSVLLCTQAAARHMIERGRGGRIINASSAAGKRARRNSPMGAYVTTKHAVIGLTRAFAVELAEYGITVNAYCPGVVDTPMWEVIDREVAGYRGVPAGQVRAEAVADIPLGRIEHPEDVAGLVAFLASDDAAYMTGQAVNVTGGLVMH